jgi:beta-glucosidase
MKASAFLTRVLLAVMINLHSQAPGQTPGKGKAVFQPLAFQEADRKAHEVLTLMTLDERIAFVGGDRDFFIRPLARLGLREVYMTDATQGVHIREKFRDTDLSHYRLEKSTAFPCPILLASTWNPRLSFSYAEAIGEECRAGGIGILLGPGMNAYRISQCGRNFEYFGEDPFLRSRMIEEYVKGVQSTGTIATLKHFVANNTEFYRRRSNSVVDERTLHEIYLPPFKAGIDAGAKAVMTSYNLLNGEWCGQSRTVINDILRSQLGFRWLVMTDWWSVDSGEKLARSGQDLEMPHAIALKDARTLINDGKVKVDDIDRMVLSIVRTYFAMKLDELKPDPAYYDRFKNHEQVALQTAREGIVLLKNDGSILPLKESVRRILLTGDYIEKVAAGGGSASVQGYGITPMVDALKREFGNRLTYEKNPTRDQIASADVVLCTIGTADSEGWDRAFELPEDQEKKVKECVDCNANTVVIVTSGSGIRMTDWSAKAKAILYAWYVGQNGNIALAEILAGKTNPSGKLPITIEREFNDSPGKGYLPAGEQLYSDWPGQKEMDYPVWDLKYGEGIFVGYRWYEAKNIDPLFPFGHGLSYTAFTYDNLKVTFQKPNAADSVAVSFTIRNDGRREGSETAQLYVQDVESSVPRPVKELKAFQKVDLKPGETRTITLNLDTKAFSFWNPGTKAWFVEKGKFIIHVGSSSADIRLKEEIEIQ